MRTNENNQTERYPEKKSLYEPIRFRDATVSDLKQIRDIMSYYIENTTTNWSEHVLSVKQLRIWLHRHDMKNWPVQVAVDQSGQILGYSSLSDFRNIDGYRYCAENSVYVKAGYQGYGIGDQLMHRIIEQARKTNIRSIIAMIDSSNQASVNFHKKFGFHVSGELKNIGYKHHRWLSVTMMQCDLFPVRTEF